MMQSMIITPNPDDPEVQKLTEELNKRGYKVNYLIPSILKLKSI